MDSLSPHALTPQKPIYYTYTLSYPESMGGYVFYVGKGKGNRIYEHEIFARRVTSPNSHKTNIIRKVERLGMRIVRKKLGLFENETDAFLYETALIFFMRPYGHLTNLTDGGEGVSGGTHVCPEEVKRKLSALNKGKPGQKISEEGKRRISEARLKKVEAIGRKPLPVKKDRHHSEEWKVMMSEKQKGRSNFWLVDKPLTEEHKQAISKGNEGKVTSESTKQKQREAALNRPPISEVTRHRMSEAAKQRMQKRNASRRLQPEEGSEP